MNIIQPQFTITNTINKLIAEIEQIRTRIDMHHIFPEYRAYLRKRATVSSIHCSTSIEGNPLNEREVAFILEKKSVQSSEYAICEAQNYFQAISWCKEHLLQKKGITFKDIQTIHTLLMSNLLPSEKVGKVRYGPVYIVDEIQNKEVVRYTGPHQKDIKVFLKMLMQWINQQQKTDMHPLFTCACFHYFFLAIHPFSDGNGRVTRLCSWVLLSQFGYGCSQLLSIDSFFLSNRMRYYQSLSLGSTFFSRIKADLTPFISFFIEGYASSIQHVYKMIQKGKRNETFSSSTAIDSFDLTILEYVQHAGSVSTQDMLDISSTPRRTIQRSFQKLVQAQLLQPIGKGRAHRYRLQSTRCIS